MAENQAKDFSSEPWADSLPQEDRDLLRRGRFTVPAAAAYLACSEKFIYSGIKSGRIRVGGKVGKRYQLLKEELDKVFEP